ncbi:hypothetical protein [Cellulomonas endometrii]|uniref:hypothetical protein n=1 Tax=Cellulomonas endometrii TaxID=3036301 RepID=UPI0024AE2B05|nr:hypothetical protein [Cellulomonas endometrii]
MITTPTHPRTRAPRALALALTAGALVVGTAACTGGTAEAEDSGASTSAPEPVTTTEDDAGGTESAAASDGLLAGTRQVDIQTYGDEWVTTTVEGGVTTVADPAEAGGVPTTWVFEPSGTTFQVRTTATTDGQPSCLSLPGDDVITVAPCDPAAPDQQLDVATLDQPDQVNLSSAAGVVVADQEGGLALEPDPSSPASVFTLVDRGAAEG